MINEQEVQIHVKLKSYISYFSYPHFDNRILTTEMFTLQKDLIAFLEVLSTLSRHTLPHPSFPLKLSDDPTPFLPSMDSQIPSSTSHSTLAHTLTTHYLPLGWPEWVIFSNRIWSWELFESSVGVLRVDSAWAHCMKFTEIAAGVLFYCNGLGKDYKIISWVWCKYSGSPFRKIRIRKPVYWRIEHFRLKL